MRCHSVIGCVQYIIFRLVSTVSIHVFRITKHQTTSSSGCRVAVRKWEWWCNYGGISVSPIVPLSLSLTSNHHFNGQSLFSLSSVLRILFFSTPLWRKNKIKVEALQQNFLCPIRFELNANQNIMLFLAVASVLLHRT